MNLTYHTITKEEGKQVCDWKYPDEYACYNQPPFEEIQARQAMFCNPLRRTNYRAFYDSNLLIGFTNLREQEQEVFLGIGVHPDHCSKGYGTAIVELCCRISEELYPGKTLYLEVRTWNNRAIRCYEKCGFVIDGEPFEQRTYSGIGTFYRMIRK